MKKRNLNKFMGLILSAIMIISTAFVTVNADAVNTIDFTQDFENATADNCGLTFTNFDFKTVQVGNSKVLEVYNSTQGKAIRASKDFDTAINSGKLAVDFTMRIAPRQGTNFALYDGDNKSKNIINVYFGDNTNQKNFAVGVSGNGYKFGDEELHWIKAHFIFDLDSKKFRYIITDEYDNILLDNTTKDTNIGINNIKKIEINTVKKGSNNYDDVPVYLDDIKITNTKITDLATVKAELSPVKARILPISDDFDSYTDIDAVQSAWTITGTNTSNDLTQKRDITIVESNGNKRIKLNGHDAGIYKNIGSNPVESGKIKVTADYVPSDKGSMFGLVINGNSISGSGALNVLPMFYFNDKGKVYLAANSTSGTLLGDYKAGDEYHLEAIIDMDSKLMDVKMTGNNNGNATNLSANDIKISKYNNIDVEYINGFCARNYGSATYDTTITYFDNFNVAYSGLASPLLSNDKVEFYDDDIKGNTDDLSPNTNKITLDFGTVMNQFTLYNQISLTDSNGANVPYKATFSKNVYTLKIPGRLKASETYTLTVPATVENELGGTLEGRFTMTFTTNAGEVSAAISPKNATGVVIDGLSGLAAGNEIKAEISYKNSTGEAVSAVAIFAYFDGDILRDVSLEPVTISADDKTGEATITHTVKDLKDTKSMKIMFWDINTIEPFAEYIDLK